MMAINIVAAGVVSVAAALSIRQALGVRAAGERGFDRQAAVAAEPSRGGVSQFQNGVSPFKL